MPLLACAGHRSSLGASSGKEHNLSHREDRNKKEITAGSPYVMSFSWLHFGILSRLFKLIFTRFPSLLASWCRAGDPTTT